MAPRLANKCIHSLFSAPRRSRIALPLLLLYTTHVAACTSWQVASAPAIEAEQLKHPVEVRMATSGGGSFRLDSAMVARDSISGRVIESGSSDTTGVVVAEQGGDSLHPRVSVPVNAVRTLEWRQASAGKTVLLVSGVVVGILAVMVGITAAACAGEDYVC